MHLVAGILHNWDIEPTSASWEVPGHVSATGVCRHNKDVRVLNSEEENESRDAE